MTDNSTTTETPTPRVVNIINFHGLTMWVVEHDGIQYIYVKPLSDLAGLDWRSAKKTLQESDNAILYGTTWMKHPISAAEGGTSTPTKEGLYVRLDRARMYLARINTKMMRGKGAEEAADELLQLQIEWAEALHDYETQGLAVKTTRQTSRRKDEESLSSLVKTREKTIDQAERQALTNMIADKLSELGYPPETNKGKQQELELPED
ncbi:MAG: phage antirepressor N-terminal domain-containing protein [Candidatus Sedimenticola sp. (ex Thyasira tokunagai)]